MVGWVVDWLVDGSVVGSLWPHLFTDLGYSGHPFFDDFGTFFDDLLGSGGTLERYWDPGSIFSENGTRKTFKKSPFWESVFNTC